MRFCTPTCARFWLVLTSALIVLMGSVPLFFPAYAGASITPFAFFKNSTRRQATLEEKDTVVKLGQGCAGFFVRNRQKRALIITARHCVNMSITNWCTAKGQFIDEEKIKGTCEKIIAADLTHDIAMFEGKLSYTPTPEQGLALAAYAPEVKTRLTMIGYPADKFQNGKLTTTENCWITVKDVPSTHGANMADKSSKHNCTTYGGNSGGPMIAEGSRIAVGLPFTYYPGDYIAHEADVTSQHALMAHMEDFVSVHRKELDDAGVEIVEAKAAPTNSPPPPPASVMPDPKTKKTLALSSWALSSP